MNGNARTRRRAATVAALLLAALAVGLLAACGGAKDEAEPAGAETADAVDDPTTIWTCSMHPQIRLPAPGKCPICFMDLIPVETGIAGDDTGAPRLEMSAAARAMAEIETAPVVRDRAFAELRLVGKVAIDETRVSAITAWVPGRLDRLYVDYTGSAVRKGDHLAEIYSPELLSAKQELLQAIKTREATRSSGSAVMRTSAEATVDAAREKLRLLGLTARQIDDLARDASSSDHITIFAHSGGVVVEKNAVEGDYVKTGAVIYRIADLGHLWVKLDAYESDLAWLRYGQGVEFMTEAVPGRVFRGEVVFISPTLDPRTRTSKVRVHVDNREGLLKPEMFVRATVLAELGSNGRVLAEDLAGKWICPMHPEVVRDAAGKCDVCGMALERAEDLGYVTAPDTGGGSLLIPRTAALFTGKRAVVYVEVPDAETPTYEGREVVLGPRAGDRYVVDEGLSEGERVVVKGNFKIDSALQIQAKPSMMSARPPRPTGEAAGAEAPAAPADPAFVTALTPLYGAYFDAGEALAADDAAAARTAFAAAHTALHEPDASKLDARGRREWSRLMKELMPALEVPKDADLGALRAAYRTVSTGILELEATFGHAGDAPFYRTFCPMAFGGEGAPWMQDHEQIDNPWYGAKMLRCGSVKESLPAVGEE